MEIFDNITQYSADLINQQKIFLEIRLVDDPLYIEKYGFMELNKNRIIDIDNNCIHEITDWEHILLKRIPAITDHNHTLKPKYKFMYTADRQSLIYTVWVDKNNKLIIPGRAHIKIISEDITYTIMN